jgi:signal peptidase I
MTGDFTVGDLMLETTATLQADAELALELCQGKNRYQARFQPGKVQFVIDDVVRGEVPCPVAAGRAVQLAFANFDGELRVWVDGRRIKPFSFSPEFVPTEVGAFQPTDPPAAALVAKGSVTATDLVLWMDTYFTPAANDGVNYQLLGLTLDTFYVQPGHYLCLGDNSGQSSDSRKWGLVPERLMLGQAQFIFFPLNRLGRIH